MHKKNMVTANLRRNCNLLGLFLLLLAILQEISKSQSRTVLPRKPTNVATTDLTNTSVRITWQSRKSNFTAWYTVECSTAESGSAACKGILYSPEAKNITSTKADLRKLHPYTNYKFTIYAKNAASRNLPKKYWPNETIAFMTRPGLPSEVGSFLYKVEKKTLTLGWQPPPFKRDAVVYYETKCDGMKMKRTFYPYITISIGKQDAITCQVRATNTAGKGPWRTKTIILSGGLSSLETGMISVSVVVVCFIMLIVIVVVWKRSKKRRRRTSKNEDTVRWKREDSSEPNVYDPVHIELKGNSVDNVGFQDDDEEPVYIEIIGDDFEYPFDKLDRKKVLGQGEFGVVYRACALDISGSKGVSQVAVKILKENARERDQRDFLNELSIMKTIRPHQNVVRLLGCCTLTGRNCIILEYLRHGNLQVFLRKSRGYYGSNECELHTSVLSANQLLQFCFMIADGMNHISSQNVIHRDLACRNILVGTSNGQYVCKIGDLGLARQLDESTGFYQRVSQEKLPIKWMAYESLFEGIFSVKSDVWSFGVALYEIFTVGDTPYPLFKSKEMALQIKNGHRMSKPPHCSVELYEIMMKCWNNDANLRPSFSNLKDTFQELLSKDDHL
eukprot:Seg6654.1 transcript_id=Seg6654.1/GoldUCD/mRNA.D3Y31 product="Tyrosine kinase receptor Cad96Ca" protein_id=Seg6654.1/GoldUCD/D3Y31